MATEITTPDSGDTEQSEQVKEPSIWIRGLYMLLFLIITRITEVIVGLVMFIQFILKAATGNTNKNLVTFGNQLSQYLFAIVQFQTFNSEDRPFPFNQWPHAEEPEE